MEGKREKERNGGNGGSRRKYPKSYTPCPRAVTPHPSCVLAAADACTPRLRSIREGSFTIGGERVAAADRDIAPARRAAVRLSEQP